MAVPQGQDTANNGIGDGSEVSMWHEYGDCGFDAVGKINPADPESDNCGFSDGWKMTSASILNGIISMAALSYRVNL